MSPPTTAQRSVDAATHAYDRLRLWRVVVAACALGLLVLVSQVLQSPGAIDRISVENPTRYDISVLVTERDRDGWIDIGIVPRESTGQFDEIVDQGEVWIFRFSAQGHVGGELRLNRAELEQARWKVVIPAAVEAVLRDEGAPFPP